MKQMIAIADDWNEDISFYRTTRKCWITTQTGQFIWRIKLVR